MSVVGVTPAANPPLATRVDGQGRFSLLFFFLLANNFTVAWPPLTSETISADITGSLKFHHLFAISLLGFVTMRGRWPLSRSLTVFFAIAIGVLLFTSIVRGTEPTPAVNLFYCIYVAVLALRLYDHLGQETFLRCLRIAGRIFLAATALEVIFNFQQYADTLAGISPHPIGYLVGGGGGNINIEVAEVIIVTALEFNTEFFWPFVLYSLCFALGTVSRSGIVIALFLAMFWMWSRLSPGARILFVGALAGILGVVGSIIAANTTENAIIARIINTGALNDPGTLGRVILWYGAAQAFLANPFGYGPGQAANLVANAMPDWLGENNIHNIFLQLAVDTGIQGLLAYLFVVWVVLRNFARSGWRHPLGAAISIYYALGLQEFRAYDMLAFLLMGVYTMLEPNSAENLAFLPSRRSVSSAIAQAQGNASGPTGGLRPAE